LLKISIKKYIKFKNIKFHFTSEHFFCKEKNQKKLDKKIFLQIRSKNVQKIRLTDYSLQGKILM